MAGEILTELNRIDSNIDAAFEKCRALGATMPSTINSDYLADTIETIPSSADIPVKTAADMTVSGATVTAPAGWYKQAASKAVPTATQATPSISVNSSGLITASATQSAGYVPSGTKSATKQLTQQAAKTVTPTKSEQTAVAAGVFTTGAVKVAKIPDSYIQPSGTKSITENGTHDVKSFASVNVNVPSEDLKSVLDAQEQLISEIEAELEGKAAGGGGGSVETCTVTFDGVYAYGAVWTNGASLVIDDLSCFPNGSITVPKGSTIVIEQEGSFMEITATSGTPVIAKYGALSIVLILGDCTLREGSDGPV
jgi:hypothetical protein